MKFGVLLGILVYFIGIVVATLAVFLAGYITLFFLEMDLLRLLVGRRLVACEEWNSPGDSDDVRVVDLELEEVNASEAEEEENLDSGDCA